MARFQQDGSILTDDGRIIYADSPILAQDFAELTKLLGPAPSWPFVSGGGGSGGAGERGFQGPAGTGGGGTIGPIDNAVFVGKNGNDATADGSIANPFLTVAAAMASVVGASPTNRFALVVAPGRYNETLAINLRANVFIFGTHWMATRIAAPSWGLDVDMAPAGDQRSGIQNAIISASPGAIDFDFNAIASNEGKLYFDTVWFNNPVTITAFSPINQYIVRNGFTFGPWIVNGGQFIPGDMLFQAAVTFNSGPTDPACVFLDDHSSFIGGLTLNKTGVTGYSVTLYGSSIDVPGLAATGAFIVNATGDAIPIKASVVLAGGATLNRLTDAFGEGYTPAVPAQWAAPPPTNVDNALNRLAAAVFGLVGPIP